MQNHRNDGGEQAPRSANPSPPLRTVHGLGESHALRVDLQPVQLPWLADEIDTLRASIREEHERVLARSDELPPAANRAEAEAEVHRRAYQLRVLAMIREQLPLSSAVAAAAIASPWQDHDELVWELARITARVTVLGPARAMLVLMRGSARNVADALGEALRGPRSDTRAAPVRPALLWPEWTRTTPAVASRLRDMAAAAQAFTDTYVSAVLQQSYSFDPDHDPVLPDELW
ncbi:MAG: hypothetical protein QOD71_3503 [Thermoleophilaceae bacterium]|jgi:hypothetical protein|nr:hypothetical protein [Thermoleophilaceae bacterium]